VSRDAEEYSSHKALTVKSARFRLLVLEDRTEPVDGSKDLGFVGFREADRVGVAATFEVEDL
jgi:hypothetical protein